MASKRRQGEGGEAEKRRRKRCEEAAQLCRAVGEEPAEAVREAWSRGSSLGQGDLELDPHPFPHCIIRNFLRSSSFLEGLRAELMGLNFHDKSNDLYKFKQSDDLKKRTEPHIAGLRAALFGPFRCWLERVLGVRLEPTVDISCAQYEYTDVLLCHDDELEGRRAAFILYLVPPWQSGDGGTLDLYSTDGNFQPQSVAKSLVPSMNTLVLFEVSPVSFHQVAEVLAKDKCRLSLSGWFHGPPLERPPHHTEAPVPRSPHLPRDESVLLEWVNPAYLDVSYQEQIQENFEDSSEIQLKDFLKEEKFREVSEALQLTQIQWTKRGPPNKRCYDVASPGDLPQCVMECWELLHSEAFFLLLSNFTGLRLHYLCPNDDEDDDDEEAEGAKERGDTQAGESSGSRAQSSSSADAGRSKEPSTPACCGELRRWSHGGYTLLHDAQAAQAEFALDLVLPFCTADWQADFGGSTCYVANEEDEELLTVYPEDNCLALVYRDKETLKFVKHINHKSSSDSTNIRAFYDFSFVYFE